MSARHKPIEAAELWVWRKSVDEDSAAEIEATVTERDDLRTELSGFVSRLGDSLLREEALRAELAAMKAQRDEAQIALGVARAALEECDANFAAIRDDWSDPRSECRAGRFACEMALEAIAKVTP